MVGSESTAHSLDTNVLIRSISFVHFQKLLSSIVTNNDYMPCFIYIQSNPANPDKFFPVLFVRIANIQINSEKPFSVQMMDN